jgi:hypothetical protein
MHFDILVQVQLIDKVPYVNECVSLTLFVALYM